MMIQYKTYYIYYDSLTATNQFIVAILFSYFEKFPKQSALYALFEQSLTFIMISRHSVWKLLAIQL